MFQSSTRKPCLNYCIAYVLVIVAITKAQNTEYTEWKPIKLYVAGNITLFPAISKLNHSDDLDVSVPPSSKGFKWKYSSQERINGAEDRSINREDEVTPERSDWQEISRSVAVESLGGIAQAVWTTDENSGDTIDAENKEEEEQSRKKKKKLLKKLALPLLLLYKIKFLMLIPVLVTAMILLSGSSGLAGFFFALFATMMAFGKEH